MFYPTKFRAITMMLMLLLVSFPLTAFHPTARATNVQLPSDAVAGIGVNQALPHTVYLPFVARDPVARSSIFGGEIVPYNVGPTISKIEEANVSWVRYNGILWSDVEATQGVRDWSKLGLAEAELRTLWARGTAPIVIVRGTPAWARKYGDADRNKLCSPIRADAFDEFANFMGELASRYHYVRHWEIWNEPDVDPILQGPDTPTSYTPFGCWGDQNDEYYGGGYYAEMLKHVYPAIKRANPNAQVVLGGLLLDCDATHTYDNPRDCAPSKFLEGVLRNGGGAAFDILSYHGYPIWTGTAQEDWDLVYQTWRHRGGVVLGKLSLIRSVFRQYNVSKPILLTEGGLICYRVDAGCPSEEVRQAQANYVVRLYTRGLANGLAGIMWFTFDGPGYRESGILDGAQQPRPAYLSFKFLSGLLQGATFGQNLSTSSYEGYSFRKGSTTYQIYWTNNTDTVVIPLPPGTRTVYDKYGANLQTTEPNATVKFDPIIVEVAGG